jgi:hypothetical protein
VPLVAALATACGGGSDREDRSVAAANQGISGAAVKGCSRTDVHDTGTIVYLLVDRSCMLGGRIAAEIKVTAQGRETAYPVSFDQRDSETVLTVKEGISRTVSVHQKGTWRSFPNKNSWGWRDGAGLLVKDGKLFLLGGYRGGEGNQNEVWSSANVRDWSLLTVEAPWYGRHGAAWVVHQNKLFVISGDLNDDAWSSFDGIHWTQESINAPFHKRYTPNAISTGEQMILYGGLYWEPYDWCAFQPECQAKGFSDVWGSGDGRSWTLLNPKTPWEGRGLIHGAAYFQGRIYLVGGGLKMGMPGLTWAETVKEYSDIWSSADGITWRKEASELGLTARTHFSIVATPGGCFVTDGSVGTQGNFSNDVFFAPDCVHYQPIPDAVPMQKRHASSLAYFNGSLVILGGPPYGGPETTAGTEVWQYFPDID